MVDTNDIYLVMSTVAVLHETPETKKINIKDFEKVLSPPITAIPSLPEGMLISSQRDQIEILLTNNKTDFRDLSGRKDFSSSKIGKLVGYFVNEFGLNVNTYGINFILRVPCPKPQNWIMKSVLSSEITKKTGIKLIGGKGTISLKSGRKTWNIGFEPTEHNEIEINFNATEKRNSVPIDKTLRNEFKEQWKLLVEFFNNLNL